MARGGLYFTGSLRRFLTRRHFRYIIHFTRGCTLSVVRCGSLCLCVPALVAALRCVNLGRGFWPSCALRVGLARLPRGPAQCGFCAWAKTFVSFAASRFGRRELNQKCSMNFCCGLQKFPSLKNAFCAFRKFAWPLGRRCAPASWPGGSPGLCQAQNVSCARQNLICNTDLSFSTPAAVGRNKLTAS